jgi:hypothetical protein
MYDISRMLMKKCMKIVGAVLLLALFAAEVWYFLYINGW